MTREEVERSVRALFQCRLDNDIEGTLAHFETDAFIQFAGSPQASSFAASYTGQREIRNALDHLISTWTWQDWEPVSILIDGKAASVQYHLHATHNPSGKRVATQSVDLVQFNDQGKVAQMVEYVDTALTQKLFAAS